MSSFTTETYSARQLSPFTGNVQIIQTPFARALSLDGNSWQIQTICESHQQQWDINNHIQRRFIIYGTWDIQNQLSRYPIDPTLDVPDESIISRYLINCIKNNLDNLPFKSADSYEFWLLNKETSLPVALLATSIDKNLISASSNIKRWRSRSGTESEFTSISTKYTSNPFITLETEINKLTSSPISAQWFFRNNDRSGSGLKGQTVDMHLHDRTLPSSDFPELLLKTHWDNTDLATLCNDYTHWLAPRLLTLQHISKSNRLMLESAAQHQPIEVLRYHKNYPEILNTTLINKVLVEAKLRISS
ncbi:MAG: hypothetical protein OQK76_06795 [Gammaproteobacteria bacterium]|nr:hypothetical protein [Gammaproteobacteria bacterium]MCW8910313.1 hypothetical protein [Gammaproteobacteria bacterium]MCW9004436.1 hypothetical protein [Gammaproteobacteria bacterium]MCW9055132.1 hypothetical protein [Gammaproteobacteria bacterium]